MKTYPLLPLRDIVVFPHGVSSLFVGRDKSMEATRAAMDSDRLLVLVAQKETDTIIPAKNDLHNVGVLCEILQLLKMPDGTFKILVEGLRRVVIQEFFDDRVYQEVKVREYESVLPEGELELQVLNKVVTETLQKFEDYFRNHRSASDEYFERLYNRDDREYTIDAIADALTIPFAQKQAILESAALIDRAERVNIALDTQIEMASLESSIHDKVRTQMDKVQRRYYLNEQMKAIREEMSEGELDEFDEYRKKIGEAGLPDEVRTRAEQELRKLEKMPLLSAESTVVRNYLDWIIDLPWDTASEENRDLVKAEEILENSHHGLEKVKDRILEFIAVRQLSATSAGPILCLVGPPGVGKTSLARSLAECLGREFGRISLGGMRDEAEVRGHRRTYIGSLPGRLISTLKKVKARNPVILLDEIDKISADYRGNPGAALLEVLDPEQNKEFTDHYLELPFDLSQVLFIATANVSDTIPAPLLDRLEVIELSGYTETEKIQIVKKHVVPKLVRNTGIKEVPIRYSSRSIAYIIRHYTREAGVRQIERELAKITRKIARDVVQGDGPKKYELDKSNIRRFLGPEQFNYNRREKESAIGKCNGLAWTPVGGDIMDIEVALAYGTGELVLTGNLGHVMKESASTALGCVRARAHTIGLSNDFFEKTDIFVHVPEGAIPKDGPSAGIAIATSLVSALAQRQIKNTVAMTGEITLRGMVLPIGGLKEKVLAAYRGGVSDIVCPAENEKDMQDIPESVREKLQFHFVSDFTEVVAIAITGGEAVFRDMPGLYPFAADHLNTSVAAN